MTRPSTIPPRGCLRQPSGRGAVVDSVYRNGRVAATGDAVISANGLDEPPLFTIRCDTGGLARRGYYESAGTVALLDGPLVYVRPDDGDSVYLAAAGDLIVQGDS